MIKHTSLKACLPMLRSRLIKFCLCLLKRTSINITSATM